MSSRVQWYRKEAGNRPFRGRLRVRANNLTCC